MPKEESYEVIDRSLAPAENVLITLDSNGIVDSSSRRLPFFTTITKELIATSVDTYLWTCPEGQWEITRAESIISVTGGTGADIMVEHCTGVVAPASGTDQLTAVLDLEETAPAKALGTLIATPTPFQPGDNLAVYFTGTLTGLVGAISITLKRTG